MQSAEISEFGSRYVMMLCLTTQVAILHYRDGYIRNLGSLSDKFKLFITPLVGKRHLISNCYLIYAIET